MSLLQRPATLRLTAVNKIHARRVRVLGTRNESTAAPADTSVTGPPPTPQQGWLYVDSVFPIRLGRWDLRHYIGVIRSDALLSQLEHIFSSIHAHEFKLLELDPHPKDGGVFVRFEYTAPGEDVDNARLAALERIKQEVDKVTSKEGGVPNWTGIGQGKSWIVKGKPWREDLNRFPSPIVKVAFEGPDVNEEALYNLFRPFGRIQDIANPTPPPAGILRAATITFRHLSSATVARNVLHGLNYIPDSSLSGPSSTRTRLRTAYQPPVQAHLVRDWLQTHPKITGPLVIFLLGTSTYTVFDPIRAFMIEGKILDWFDYKQYQVYQWVHQLSEPFFGIAPVPMAAAAAYNADDDEPLPSQASSSSTGDNSEVWKERRDAQDALERYLSDVPTTIAFVHGPQGSGKTRMLTSILEDNGRKTLIIDCAALLKGSSDSAVVNALAQQTGYWPVFSFLNSFNTWIDLASVGLIGQKAGLSTSLPTQVQDMLDVVKSSLSRVSTSYRTATARAVRAEQIKQERALEEQHRLERLSRGDWHDGRLDCVAGNGIMSELGIGDERFEGWAGVETKQEDPAHAPTFDDINVLGGEKMDYLGDDEAQDNREKDTSGEETEKQGTAGGWRASLPSLPSFSLPSVNLSSVTSLSNKVLVATGISEGGSEQHKRDDSEGDANHGSRARVETDAVRALPIVVLRNFGSRGGTNKDSDEVLAVIAKWAAGLTENKIAHVVVMSDNRENVKRLAKALPSKPLNSIALSDADVASALSFVRQKLRDAGGPGVLTQPEEAAYVSRLSGRASDLESLIHKVQGGLTVQEAVEDIIQRDVAELRKNAFGDDADDAKNLPWAREQAWPLFKRLVKQDEVSYHDVLVNMFKNDETALRSMEHAELIAIGTDNGRPSTIKPGKPVYKYVFDRLVSDSIFRATQDLAVNEKAIASAEAIIRSSEEELVRLREIGSSRTARKREDYLLDKMHDAQKKIVTFEAQNIELKKVLAKVC